MTTRRRIRDLGVWLGLAASALALVGLLASAARAAGTEIDRIAEVLRLRAGQVVADVGAGDGEWSAHLGRVVGEQGHVFATEVAPDLVQALNDRFQRDGLTNVETVLGRDDGTGLAPESCDAILLRLV